MTKEQMKAMSDEDLLKYAKMCTDEMTTLSLQEGIEVTHRKDQLLVQLKVSIALLNNRGIEIQLSEETKKAHAEFRRGMGEDPIIYIVIGAIISAVATMLYQGFPGSNIVYVLYAIGPLLLIYGIWVKINLSK